MSVPFFSGFVSPLPISGFASHTLTKGNNFVDVNSLFHNLFKIIEKIKKANGNQKIDKFLIVFNKEVIQ